MNITNLDDFTLGYIECALWSTNDESTPNGGKPLDYNYDIGDIAESTLKKIVEDCKKFQEDNSELLMKYYNERIKVTSDPIKAYAGHDFWLTRNGHGCGFWDRDLGKLGEQLTEASHKFGECWLYVGDDKKIYLL